VRIAAVVVLSSVLASVAGALRQEAEDGRGELYICDIDGEVYKLVPAPATPAVP